MLNGKTPAEQKANFGDGAILGAIITLLAAEAAIWALSEERRGKSAAAAAAKKGRGVAEAVAAAPELLKSVCKKSPATKPKSPAAKASPKTNNAQRRKRSPATK